MATNTLARPTHVFIRIDGDREKAERYLFLLRKYGISHGSKLPIKEYLNKRKGAMKMIAIDRYRHLTLSAEEKPEDITSGRYLVIDDESKIGISLHKLGI